jgi:nucleotide-binding universal stress UspA family protein
VSDDDAAHFSGRPRPPDWDEPLRIPEIASEIRTILAPVDGSEHSERGLAYASILAKATGAAIVVIVAFDPPHTIRRRGTIAVVSERSEMEQDAIELAEEAVALLKARGHEARAVAARGDAVSAILETADAEHADLVVMGRRGLSALHGMVGSVSERVARHASVPVVLVS